MGSKPVVGSSYNIISGFKIKVLASPTRLRIPPDNSEGILSMASSKPTLLKASITNVSFSALGIGGGGHGQMTGRQLEAIELVLIEEKPDMVLVYGDTNSTLAGTLAAVKLNKMSDSHPLVIII